MRKYLNSKEMNDLLFTFHLLEHNSKVVNEWQHFDNLTTKEAGHLRKAITWTEKFLESVLTRLEPKEMEKVNKRTIKAMKDPVRVLDKWMHDRIFGSYDTEYEIVKVERPQFEKLSLACIQAHCQDCKNSFNSCDIYDIFADNLVPRAELKHNCPYAFDSEKTIKEREEKAKARLEAKGKVSKRKSKKVKNRFDEENELTEYNFTPKGSR